MRSGRGFVLDDVGCRGIRFRRDIGAGCRLCFTPPVVPRTFPALATDFGLRLAAPLPFQNPCPVELQIRIARFEQTNRFFVERPAPDADAGRRAKPVEDSRPTLAAPARRLNDEGVLVTPFVLVEAELRQDYFLLDGFTVFFAAGLATRLAAGFFADEFDAAVFFTSRSGLAAALGGAALRASAGVARCTSVNLV